MFPQQSYNLNITPPKKTENKVRLKTTKKMSSQRPKLPQTLLPLLVLNPHQPQLHIYACHNNDGTDDHTYPPYFNMTIKFSKVLELHGTVTPSTKLTNVFKSCMHTK